MNGRLLSDEERLDWLRLIRSERVGPRTFRALVARSGSARAALEALPDLARRAGRGPIRICSRADALRELEMAERLGARFVADGEPDYPPPLKAIDDAPPLLAVRGTVEAVSRPVVAIVGSRNASAAGGTFAERIAVALGEAGYVVASGLARGIDTRAHKAALAAGTIAVLAGGHDRLYPSENAGLLERIVAEGGAAVTEMPFGWEPRGRDFPRRNRIVSGLALGVIVVEAARRSGSLITARFAGEQGREVFAVPGSPLDPRAEGTNDLIRNGATLCASADDVLGALAPLLAQAPEDRRDFVWREPQRGLFDADRRPLWEEMDPVFDADIPAEFPAERVADPSASAEPGGERARVEALLGASPVTVDELVRQAELPVRTVQTILVELELAGRLLRHGGDAVSAQPTGS